MGFISAKYRNYRQTSVSANRVWYGTAFITPSRSVRRDRGAIKFADGFVPRAVTGLLIDMKAVKKVEAHIADALKKGAKVVTGGKRAAAINIKPGRQLLRASIVSRVKTRWSRWPTTPPPFPPPLAGEG